MLHAGHYFQQPLIVGGNGAEIAAGLELVVYFVAFHQAALHLIGIEHGAQAVEYSLCLGGSIIAQGLVIDIEVGYPFAGRRGQLLVGVLVHQVEGRGVLGEAGHVAAAIGLALLIVVHHQVVPHLGLQLGLAQRVVARHVHHFDGPAVAHQIGGGVDAAHVNLIARNLQEFLLRLVGEGAVLPQPVGYFPVPGHGVGVDGLGAGGEGSQQQAQTKAYAA